MTSVPVGTDAALPVPPLPQHDPALEHPRPQLTRPGWEDLGGTWAFAYDDEASALGALATARRRLRPDDPGAVPRRSRRPAGSTTPASTRSSGTAARSGRPRPAGARVLLHFGAVDYRAHVWVNGRLVACHEGGHTPFPADITDALDDCRHQVVSCAPRTAPHDPGQPRGKQDWRPEPHDIWYHRTTGIWQPVWWEVVPATRVRSLRWTPDLVRGSAGLTVAAAHRPAGGATAAPARGAAAATAGSWPTTRTPWAMSRPSAGSR